MTKPRVDPKGTPRKQAGYWVWRQHSGEWSSAEQRELEQWLAGNDTHRHEYARALDLWQALEDFKAAEFPARSEARRRYRQAHPRRRSIRWIAAMATAAALSLAVGIDYWQSHEDVSYRTAKGKQLPVTLADGSRVELNTDTELWVHLSDRERRVDLLRGEAFFIVQHDAARPFEITTAGGRIRDLGTRFDVYATPHQVTVTVDEGKVEVTTLPAHTATLGAGEQVAYTPDGALSPVTKASRNATAWREGHLAFDLAPLEEVMAQVERYHPVEIVVADPSLRALRVTGRFHFRDLLQLLRTLEATFPLRAEPVRDGHIRLSRVTQ